MPYAVRWGGTFAGTEYEKLRDPAEIAYDHLGFIHHAVQVVSPPLQHPLALWRMFGQDVHGANALPIMAQGFFDHIPVETLFRLLISP